MFTVLDAGEDVFGELGAGGGIEEVEVGFVDGEAEFEVLEAGEVGDYVDEGGCLGASVAGRAVVETEFLDVEEG